MLIQRVTETCTYGGLGLCNLKRDNSIQKPPGRFTTRVFRTRKRRPPETFESWGGFWISSSHGLIWKCLKYTSNIMVCFPPSQLIALATWYSYRQVTQCPTDCRIEQSGRLALIVIVPLPPLQQLRQRGGRGRLSRGRFIKVCDADIIVL